jgi:hypothetical protein
LVVVGKVRVDARSFINASAAAFTSRSASKLGDATNGRRFDFKFSPGAVFCIMRKHQDRELSAPAMRMVVSCRATNAIRTRAAGLPDASGHRNADDPSLLRLFPDPER